MARSDATHKVQIRSKEAEAPSGLKFGYRQPECLGVFPICGQELQIKRAFVLGNAAERLAVAQPYGTRSVGWRCTTTAASTASGGCSAKAAGVL